MAIYLPYLNLSLTKKIRLNIFCLCRGHTEIKSEDEKKKKTNFRFHT